MYLAQSLGSLESMPQGELFKTSPTFQASLLKSDCGSFFPTRSTGAAASARLPTWCASHCQPQSGPSCALQSQGRLGYSWAASGEEAPATCNQSSAVKWVSLGAFDARQTLRNYQLCILIEKEDVLITSFSSFPTGTGN